MVQVNTNEIYYIFFYSKLKNKLKRSNIHMLMVTMMNPMMLVS